MSKETNLTKYQKFETATINRKDIKLSEYNPRIISDENAARLKKGIKQHGLVQTLVWNKRTGNLVGGHQRIAQIDALEKRDDYDIVVSVIDVDEAEEKKINVQLNNDSMMGEWDIDKLKDLQLDTGIDFSDMGFSEADAHILFGDDARFEELFNDTPDATKAKDALRDIKQERSAYAEKMKQEQSAAFYFTVVCDSAEEKANLLKRLGIPAYEEYIGSFAIVNALSKAEQT